MHFHCERCHAGESCEPDCKAEWIMELELESRFRRRRAIARVTLSCVLTIMILTVLAGLAFGQTTLEFTTSQLTYLKAQSASVIPAEDGVAIVTTGLEPGQKNAVRLVVRDQPNEFIEVSRLRKWNGRTVADYPPQTIKPTTQNDASNSYIITGQVADRFAVAIRSGSQPQWIEVAIEGTSQPDAPQPDQPEPEPGELSPADLQGIEKTARDAAKALVDPITQSEIKKALDVLLAGSIPDDLQVAVADFQGAIARGLVVSAPKVQPPYKDWRGKFRVPLDAAIAKLKDKISTGKTFRQIVEATARGLASN